MCLIRVCIVHLQNHWILFNISADNEGRDQTAHGRRLIWASAVRICNTDHFFMTRLKCRWPLVELNTCICTISGTLIMQVFLVFVFGKFKAKYWFRALGSCFHKSPSVFVRFRLFRTSPWLYVLWPWENRLDATIAFVSTEHAISFNTEKS